MAGDVNPRTYDASSRRVRSDATRQRIIDAARSLMIERGYRATTIAAIAQLADVHVDTVYALVGRKPVLLRELVEQAISGTDQAVSAEDRDYVKDIRAEPDAGAKLDRYASAITRIQGRLAPVFLALREAASTEASAARVWRDIAERRATNMRLFVADVAQAAGGLRPGVSLEEAADMIWATNSAELYVLMVDERGWSPERYERWLAATWRRLLLPDP